MQLSRIRNKACNNKKELFNVFAQRSKRSELYLGFTSTICNGDEHAVIDIGKKGIED